MAATSILLERDSQLAELETALGRAREGTGSIVLVSGEAGTVPRLPRAAPAVVLRRPDRGRPLANGGLRLVGVEYVIPYAIRGPDEDPPTLFGREFLHNPTFGLWMLHVYAWKHNPDGIFATWNPAISCEHDGRVD